jgi:hypothetical protein
MRIGKPRHPEEEPTLKQEKNTNITLTGAKGAATEPLDGGARTYGRTHVPERGPKGRRFILCTAALSGAPARVCWQREEKEKGDVGKATAGVSITIASGAPGGAGPAGSQPPHVRDREWERKINGARVSRVGRVGGFVLAIIAENHPISIGWPQARGRNRPAGRGLQIAGPQSERHQLNTTQGATRAKWAMGRQRRQAEIVFHCYFS